MAINNPTWKGAFKQLRGDADNPTFGIGLHDASLAMHIIDPADAALDWAQSAFDDPTILIHCSGSNAPTDYIKMWHDDTDANIQAYGATQITFGLAGTEYLAITSAAFAPITTDGMSLGTNLLNFSDLFLDSGAVINFDSGDVTLTHSSNTLTMAGGSFTFGASGTAAGDFTLYGAVANYKVWFDSNGDTNGAWYFGANLYGILTYWYGDTTGYYVKWDPSGDTNGAWYFGANDVGVDVLFYGQTAGYAMTWDASANGLTLTGGATLTMGVDGTPSGDVTLYGTGAGWRILYDVNGDTNGAWYFGQDVYGMDVSFYGKTASNSMVWDASANSLTFTAGTLALSTTSKLVVPYKASGSTTQGDLWIDSDDDKIHYYTNASGEITITSA